MLPSSYFHILNVSCSPFHNQIHISRDNAGSSRHQLAHATHYFTHTFPHFAACQRFTGEGLIYFFRGLFLKINRLTFLHINSHEAAHIWTSETCCLFKMEKDLFLSQCVFGSPRKLRAASVRYACCMIVACCLILAFDSQSGWWRGHVTRRRGSRTRLCGGTWSSFSAGCVNTLTAAAVWVSNFTTSGGSGCRNLIKPATR